MKNEFKERKMELIYGKFTLFPYNETAMVRRVLRMYGWTNIAQYKRQWGKQVPRGLQNEDNRAAETSRS